MKQINQRVILVHFIPKLWWINPKGVIIAFWSNILMSFGSNSFVVLLLMHFCVAFVSFRKRICERIGRLFTLQMQKLRAWNALWLHIGSLHVLRLRRWVFDHDQMWKWLMTDQPICAISARPVRRCFGHTVRLYGIKAWQATANTKLVHWAGP